MDKSPDAFRTISEVAEYLDTPAHVLRFWESRFPQIRPVKRAGGRRYYRPSDVALLAGIRRLLHEDGMTIRGVQKVLRDHGVRHVAGLSGEDVADEPMPDLPMAPPVPVLAKVMPLRPAPALPDLPLFAAPVDPAPAPTDLLSRLRALPPGALMHDAAAVALAGRLLALVTATAPKD